MVLVKKTLTLKSVFMKEKESYKSFECDFVSFNCVELYIYRAKNDGIRLLSKSLFPFLNKILIKFK